MRDPNLPVSRNPLAYCAPGTQIPHTPEPPSNFSDCGVRRAELIIVRPLGAPSKTQAAFPLTLQGVAPADQVPTREVGTAPSQKLRAFISTRSNGAILYQGQKVLSK